MINRKIAFILSLTAVVSCAPEKGDTPEKAFQGYTKALLRNRRKDLSRFATEQHIKDLEGIYDLMIISAFWPANVTIQKTASRGEETALLAQGLGRDNKSAYGLFVAQKFPEGFKIIEGHWEFSDPTTGQIAAPMEDLDSFLEQREKWRSTANEVYDSSSE